METGNLSHLARQCKVYASIQQSYKPGDEMDLYAGSRDDVTYNIIYAP